MKNQALYSLLSAPDSELLWSLSQIEALKVFAKEELVSWFLEHRDNSRKLSVHVSLPILHSECPWGVCGEDHVAEPISPWTTSMRCSNVLILLPREAVMADGNDPPLRVPCELTWTRVK